MLIYDALGNLRTTEWLKAKYGEVEVHSPQAGEPCWRAFALCEDADYPGKKPGTRPSWWPKPEAAAALVAKALSEGGEPVADVPVARYWPDAPYLPPAQRHWKSRGVIGYTNGQGDTGFGMGEGDYYSPPEQGGVSWMWVAQSGMDSEAVSGLGMLAGTNHAHMNAVFRFDSGTQEPPPNEELLAVVRDIQESCHKMVEILETSKLKAE